MSNCLFGRGINSFSSASSHMRIFIKKVFVSATVSSWFGVVARVFGIGVLSLPLSSPAFFLRWEVGKGSTQVVGWAVNMASCFLGGGMEAFCLAAQKGLTLVALRVVDADAVRIGADLRLCASI